MSNPVRKDYYFEQTYTPTRVSYQKPRYKKIKTVKKQKKNSFVMLIALCFMALYGYFICPYNYKHYFEPLFLNRFLNRNLNLNAEKFIQPSIDYIKNSYLLDRYLFVPKLESSKEITQIKIINEMTSTKQKLVEMFKKYPELQPSVFVWDYQTGSGIEIDADKPYASASIIKIPIAFELMRLIDETSNTNSPVTLADEKMFTEDFRTSGSGHLQYTQANQSYTLDHLASIMISDSDNSATNMILHEIGGIDGFNRAMRNLGLKVTSMGNWLPDLEGTNLITAREISTILYNIDNPNYINPIQKEVLKNYLLSTKNVHLLKEKLPDNAVIYHKTGNIGSMLGDSGIVYTPEGKKYLVTVLVKRPHNNLRARTLIQDASLMIYNDIRAL